MRSMRSMRVRRPHLAVGALILVIPGSAVALAAGQADAQSAIQITLNSGHLAYGQDLKVTGSTSPAQAGKTVRLEFAKAHGTWRTVSSTKVGPHGHFKFAQPIGRSGFVRAVSGAGPRSALGGGASPAPLAPSTARPVAVAGRFHVRSRSIDTLSDHWVRVQGRLLPEVRHRRVLLEGRSGRHWRTLATTRTGRHGGFRLSFRPHGLGREFLKVRFAGDRLNTRAWSYVGKVRSFRESVASWYDDAGATACGFHAGYGVANRTLPCGTKVTFSYGGRTVTATVDDRGPFVGGREWDLNQTVAGALGFGGVGTVWSTR